MFIDEETKLYLKKRISDNSLSHHSLSPKELRKRKIETIRNR